MSRLKLEFNAGTLLLREDSGAEILPGVFESLAVHDVRTGSTAVTRGSGITKKRTK